ncbi:MAG TPA: AMP-binding protein [Actinomycetota bacterium]|nr:AMP-binding protein [Actinomycetota bacterium]
MSDFVWQPTQAHIEQANVTRLMRSLGATDYWDLVRRSQDDIESFWDAVIKDLGIHFFASYDQILDTSEGIAWPKWFVGGRVNLAHNCVDRHGASERAAAPAIRWEGEDGEVRELSYGKLAAEVAKAANGLAELGVGEGDRVAVYMPMVPEAVIAAYACAKLGAIYLPIFSGFGAPAVAARLNDSQAKVLITADGFWRRGNAVEMKSVADEAVAAAPSVEWVVVLNRLPQLNAPTTARDVSWGAAFDGQSPTRPSAELDPETPLMVAYTSGTTGTPKGAVHVHGGFLVKVAAEAAYQTDVKPHDVLYWVTDMGWIMGPWEMVGTHAAGACVFMYEGAPNYPSADRLWDMCARHGVSILGISPTLVRALMLTGDLPVFRHDLSKLRILGSTGEPWNPEPYRWLADVVGGGRCPIINISGGTEIGACFLGQAPVIPTKSCSLGSPALGMAIDVYTSEGKPAPRGEVGELVCTKPWPAMTRGVWSNRERYIESYWSRWPDTWVHGDWASIDEDGYWFLHGRSDDTLNVAGKRIGPAEFESAAVNHPAVAECAAVGIPDEIKGEKVWCFCILVPNANPTADLQTEIKKVVSDELGKAFTPSRVLFVEELPKTRSAKILRRAVRAVALGEDPGDLSSLENPGALEAIRKSLG